MGLFVLTLLLSRCTCCGTCNKEPRTYTVTERQAQMIKEAEEKNAPNKESLLPDDGLEAALVDVKANIDGFGRDVTAAASALGSEGARC